MYMIMISSKGKPTSATRANVGDIYVDTDTGKKYECRFVFCLSGESWSYEWEELPGQDIKPVVTVDIPQMSIEPEQPEPVVESRTVSTTREETRQSYQPNRTNYNKQYRQNKR